MATRYHVGYTSNSMLINNKELILLEVLNLKKYFPIKKGILQREIAQIKAVDAINFTIKIGETLGIVGESGCGKTTLGRTVLQLIKPTSGTVNLRSKRLAEKGKEFKFLEISNVSSKVLKLLRSEMQIIFQDPYSSLNPRLKVGTVLEEPLLVHTNLNKSERIERVKYLLNAVGLKSEHMLLHPHEFSGGQRQRIGIARSLATEPKIIVPKTVEIVSTGIGYTPNDIVKILEKNGFKPKIKTALKQLVLMIHKWRKDSLKMKHYDLLKLVFA